MFIPNRTSTVFKPIKKIDVKTMNIIELYGFKPNRIIL